MALQDIDLGTVDNDGTGNSLKAGGQKINENFTYLDNKKSGGLYGEWELVSTSTGTTTTIGNITTDSGTAASVTKISIHKNSNDGVGFNNAIEDAGYIMFTSAIGESIIFEVESAIDSPTQVAYTVYTAGGTLSTLTLNDIYKISFTTTSGVIGGNVEGGYYINNAYETGGLSPSIYKFTADNDSPQLLTSITINYTVISIMTIDYDTIAGMNRLMVKDFTTGRTAIYSIDSSIDKTTSFTLNVTKLFSSSGMPSFTSGTEYSFAFSSTETGLQKITEGGHTGLIRIGDVRTNKGDIGANAIDLSIQTVTSQTHGATGQGSVALGFATTSSGLNSLATGANTIASGPNSEASGINTIASASAAHAEGDSTTASGTASHAEGNATNAEGKYSHAEGDGTIATGDISHAEGNNTTASGNISHAEGDGATALGDVSHAEGNGTTASGTASHAEGDGTTAAGQASHAEGTGSEAIGTASHAEGISTITSASAAHAEGNNTTASGTASHAEGESTTALGDVSHAEGNGTTSSGEASHAEGNNTSASGTYSHAEGNYTTSSGTASHAEGDGTEANGTYSHAEGDGTTAEGEVSHAEGTNTIASGTYSHAEGSASVATGNISHAEGNNTESVGLSSHAEGHYTVATGAQSHAEGYWTESGANAHSQGTYTYASGGSSHTGGAGWSTTNRVTASGESAFNHSTITASEKSSVASGEYSAILGGTDNNIDISATGAVILGGLAIQATMVWTTYMNIMHLAPQSSAPLTPTEGAVYYDGVLKKLRCFDGTIWNNLF